MDLSGELRSAIEQQTSTSGDGTGKRKLLLFSQADLRPSVKVLVGVVPLASRFLGFAQQDGVFQNFDTTLVPHAQPITDVLTENFCSSRAIPTQFDTTVTRRCQCRSTLPALEPCLPLQVFEK